MLARYWPVIFYWNLLIEFVILLMSVHYLVLAKNALEVVWHPELAARVQKELLQLGANGPDWRAPDWRGLEGLCPSESKLVGVP